MPNAVGIDISSPDDFVVKPRGKRIIDTQLKVLFPSGTYGQLYTRSGHAAIHFLSVAGGWSITKLILYFLP